MAHVDRKPKAGGTTRYTSEVASGFDLIRETEVDRDFDDLYGEFNGGIDDTNIRDGASIDYAKLDLFHRLKPSDLEPGFTIPAGTVYPPDSIPGGAIAPGTLDKDRFAPGAGWWYASIGTPLTSGAVTTAESTLFDFTWTSRGSLYWMHAVFQGDGAINTLTNKSVTLRLILDLNTGTPLRQTSFIANNNISGPAFYPFSFSLTLFGAGYALAAGSHRLQVRAQVATGDTDHNVAIRYADYNFVEFL
jgi:hypothetical protein